MKPPKELRVSKDRSVMAVLFSDAEPVELSAEMLRVLSPSAEVQGHSPEQRVTVSGKRHVTISRAEPVGNYAVRLVFSDGHQSGIFTWAYLHELSTSKEAKWQWYLDDLKQKGLSRDA
ncbi:gamma-butyrobetaine hydroxylase-like domain-containing protein [Nitratireductor kimnyeongensis]|uniref:Gamma-butyrobetaine hydroxylase-like domain-containing protein n=1 Tax=Nitratireductor kimnyeongensis TaxID=430679 RepID=A0ABW0T991_9HYPH|nr:DUF971 domain-containing protein [Nitratireductor kimnyeongensis]QZZ35707.1 DUF971 domain-containing protein [Nitratireductor kimnyeongensis]